MERSALLLALALGVPPAFAEPPSSSAHGPVPIAGSQLRHLKSAHSEQEYQVKVWLPESYASGTKRYPVVYLMDGDLLFAMATDIAQYLEWGRAVPELIIVSPAYGGKHGPDKGGPNRRARDYSVFPSQVGYVPGGGEKHLRFLRDELIPYVDREFRTDPADRTLVGFSRSADFTVYTLLTAPDLFRRYISIDSFNEDYFALEEKLAASRKDLPKKVYLSHRVPNSGVRAFADKLRSRGYAGLDVEDTDVASMRHFAAAGEGLTRGLKSVFNKRSVYEALVPIAARGTADEIVAEYRRLKQMPPDRVETGEDELIELGNALMMMKRPADAARIYMLNLEAYPESAKTFSRLGTAHDRLGQRDQAIESYRQALRRNPEDQFAARAIERLTAADPAR